MDDGAEGCVKDADDGGHGSDEEDDEGAARWIGWPMVVGNSMNMTRRTL